MAKLRFGYFIAPFHRSGTNPTSALRPDLEFAEHLGALGFDEVWYGEHPSAGSEIISSPEIFIAAAAERAKRIRFGTGVISLAYHNPLWVADRLMLLDHLTHGRIIGGSRPRSLPRGCALDQLHPAQHPGHLPPHRLHHRRLPHAGDGGGQNPPEEAAEAAVEPPPRSD